MNAEYKPSPCPSCGHCPTCGQGGFKTSPWTSPWTPWYQPQPYWVYTPTITGTLTGGTSTTFTVTS